MKKHNECPFDDHEELAKHMHDHRFWVKQLSKFNKKHHKFSRKIFLTFGIFTITTLLIANIAIGSIFSLFRYAHLKRGFESEIKNIISSVSNEQKNNTRDYLNNFIYEGTYIKLTDNDSVAMDTYTGFWNKFHDKKTLLPLLNREIEIGKRYKLYIVKDIRGEQGLIGGYIVILAIINLILIGIIMKISKLLTFRLLMPINHIIMTAENISADNLSDRVYELPLDDEIGRLARVINRMIDRLEKSFLSQKRFVSNAAHELRTPLQIIKGYTDLALTKGCENKEILMESLTNVKEEIENMTCLTETLLFLTRSEEKNIDLHKEEINLNKLFFKIKNDFAMAKSDVDILIQGDDKLSIYADEKLILQAFRAVIDNSIKYSPDDKSISIDFELNEKEIFINIKDRGIGISKENLSKIFDRFYRVDEARSKEIEGLGLGLSIVQNIVKLHGGKIEIKSEKEKGTQIKFIFPIN